MGIGDASCRRTDIIHIRPEQWTWKSCVHCRNHQKWKGAHVHSDWKPFADEFKARRKFLIFHRLGARIRNGTHPWLPPTLAHYCCDWSWLWFIRCWFRTTKTALAIAKFTDRTYRTHIRSAEYFGSCIGLGTALALKTTPFFLHRTRCAPACVQCSCAKSHLFVPNYLS